jgi:hypothetical protein
METDFLKCMVKLILHNVHKQLITQFILIKSGYKIRLSPFGDKANPGFYILERV